MKPINKFMNKESEKLAKQLGVSKSDCLKLEWQEFVEKQLWQGEDEHTKNMGVGNVADWWLEKIESLLKSKQEEIEGAVENMKKDSTFFITYRTDYNEALDDLKPIITNILK